MNKEEALRYIDAYVDDELGVKDALEVQDWIGRDADCRADYERVVALKRALRGRLGGQEAPELLKRRVRKALRRERRRRSPVLRPALSAAAAVALLLFGWSVYRSMTVMPSTLVADTAMVYRVEMKNPLDYRSSDETKVAAWVSERLQQEVKPLRIPNAKLMGARLCPFLGKRGAALVYRSDGRGYALLIGDSSGMPYKMPVIPSYEVRGMKVYEAEKDGIHLAFWKQGPWLFALATDHPQTRGDMMREILRQPVRVFF